MSPEPDDRLLMWVRSVLGSDARLGEPLTGGVTSEVRLVHGEHQTAVVKRVTNPDWLAERPDVVAYEARVLGLMAPSAVPVPPVLAVDPAGSSSGQPSLLLGYVAASPAAEAGTGGELIAGLVEAASAIGSVGVPQWVRPYRRYLEPADAAPPPWSEDPAAWERAIEVVSAPPPDAPVALIHRDFHPWNVLWDGGVVAVVDWSQTSVGPITIDAAHCRMNLVIEDATDAADAFRAAWESETGTTHDPYWDLVTVIDLLPDWRPASRENVRLDRYVRSLVELID